MEEKEQEASKRTLGGTPLSLDDDLLKDTHVSTLLRCKPLNPKEKMSPLDEAAFMQKCKVVFPHILGFNADNTLPTLENVQDFFNWVVTILLNNNKEQNWECLRNVSKQIRQAAYDSRGTQQTNRLDPHEEPWEVLLRSMPRQKTGDPLPVIRSHAMFQLVVSHSRYADFGLPYGGTYSLSANVADEKRQEYKDLEEWMEANPDCCLNLPETSKLDRKKWISMNMEGAICGIEKAWCPCQPCREAMSGKARPTQDQLHGFIVHCNLIGEDERFNFEKVKLTYEEMTHLLIPGAVEVVVKACCFGYFRPEKHWTRWYFDKTVTIVKI